MTLVACRGCDLVDERPLHVIFAQLVRTTGPLAHPGSSSQPRACGRKARGHLAGYHREHPTRFLPFSIDEVLVTADAGDRGDIGVGPFGEENRPPPEQRRGEREGGDGMTEIVLAVPKRALAVLPGLAPV